MLDHLRSDKCQYVSLNGDAMSLRQRAQKYLTFIAQFWRESLILCLCVLLAILTFERAFTLPMDQDRAKSLDYREFNLCLSGPIMDWCSIGLTSDDSRWRQFQWYSSIYSSVDSKDDKAVDAAWDQIVPAHGIVAVDHQWAADRNLPASMSLPSDKSKGVYIIDA